jgi:hypothetical protein
MTSSLNVSLVFTAIRLLAAGVVLKNLLHLLPLVHFVHKRAFSVVGNRHLPGDIYCVLDISWLNLNTALRFRPLL